MTNQVMHTQASVARETVASSSGIVLLEFSAEWCPPCRMLDPIIDRLAAESPDLTVLRIDVDASPDIAREHGVMSFPTLVFFVDGRARHRLVGARGIGPLREELEQLRASVLPA
jgi:thioredoxin 1